MWKGQGGPHLLLLQHHEIEMPYTLVGILLYPFPKCLLSHHLADILVDQTPATPLSASVTLEWVRLLAYEGISAPALKP